MIAFLFLAATLPADARAVERLLDAMEWVESNGNPAAVGDGGRSIGPLQIQRAYWSDAGVPGRYDQVRDRAYARRVVRAWWRRHCPAALAAGDLERLARCHNGGPAGHRKPATRAYWGKVRAAMRETNHDSR